MIPDWIRKLGRLLPGYGNCCGNGRGMDCSGGGDPVDAQDCACVRHDMNLFSARQLDTEEERTAAKAEADRIFAEEIRQDLNPYHNRIYGTFYNFIARAVFKKD